jgi:serine/threonine-protein kinase HipA
MGRMLLRRRLEREQRAGLAVAQVRLLESDYLLCVRDAFGVVHCAFAWMTSATS